MIPLSSPASNDSEMSSSTTRSPKRLLRCWASNSATSASQRDAGFRVGRERGSAAEELSGVRLPGAGDPFRLKEHDRDEDEAVPEQPGLGQRSEQVARHHEQYGADHWP